VPKEKQDAKKSDLELKPDDAAAVKGGVHKPGAHKPGVNKAVHKGVHRT
jgi:hypothetical protein